MDLQRAAAVDTIYKRLYSWSCQSCPVIAAAHVVSSYNQLHLSTQDDFCLINEMHAKKYHHPFTKCICITDCGVYSNNCNLLHWQGPP